MLRKNILKTPSFLLLLILLILVSAGILLHIPGTRRLFFRVSPVNLHVNENLPASPGSSSTISAVVSDPDEFLIKDTLTPPRETGIYDDFITGKKKLDFKPSVELCRQVMDTVLKEYIEPVTPQILLEGAVNELRILLFDAGFDYTQVDSLTQDNNMFQAALDQFSDRVNANLILAACIRGMVNSLDDPYSVFWGKDDYEKFIKMTKRVDYKGIGLRIAKWNNSEVRVLEVFQNTPAEKAGIRKNDSIERINNTEVSKLTLDEIAKKLADSKKTEADLVVRRKNSVTNYILNREKIVIPIITSRTIDNNLGYIKIESFREELPGEFRDAYSSLEEKNIKGLILDLRNNPGGLVEAAQELCGFFLPRHSTIALFRNRSGRERQVKSRGRRIVYVPVVVLVNNFSASSSEITVGALKDHKTAVIIGTTTKGKGSVQKTCPVGEQGAVKLTIERIHTPSGFLIDRNGITPNIEIEAESAMSQEEDVILREAVNFLKNRNNRQTHQTPRGKKQAETSPGIPKPKRIVEHTIPNLYENIDI
jgi:carboxyl-terminal processing protease